MKAVLVLEDGHCFKGDAFGGTDERIGRLCLNTAVVGYQEMLTDPANAGKILVSTYPLIGNYGVAPQFNESDRVWAAGLVIKESSRMHSNWQARGSFPEFAKSNDLVVLAEVDTRSLAVHLRQKGEMSGIIASADTAIKELQSRLAVCKTRPAISMLPKISVREAVRPVRTGSRRKRVAVIDLGVTRSLLKQLAVCGFDCLVFPYDTPAEEIAREKPHGVIVSNGPEEDVGLGTVSSTVKELLGTLPVLGIAAGHQVLCRALGAKVVRMKLGHHGVNYPMSSPLSRKGEITVQNHSLTVDADSIARIRGAQITGYNLNDRSVEEIEVRRSRCIGVQYEPVSAGPDQAHPVFFKFQKMMERSN